MHWGTVTWLFFHTIAEKIKENEFNNKKEQILNIIRYLLESLPCPLCKNHAMRTIVRNPLNKIQSKEHLKLYFFNFSVPKTTLKFLIFFLSSFLTKLLTVTG